MTDLESRNYRKVFHPNGMNIDTIDMKEQFKWEKSCEYSFSEKSKLITKILTKYGIEDEGIVQRLKKCLLKGKNEFLSYIDKEYEALKKEFNLWKNLKRKLMNFYLI